MPPFRSIVLFLFVAILAACNRAPVVFEALPSSQSTRSAPLEPPAAPARAVSTRVTLGQPVSATEVQSVVPARVLRPQGAPISLALENAPLPTFISSVFGDALKVPFDIDPRVMSRNDVVSLRTAGPRSPTEFLEIVRQVLSAYGIEVVERGSIYRVIPSEALAAETPRIVRTRAQPEVPVGLRPVFQYVEVKRVKMPELRSWLNEAYGQKLRIIQLNDFNAMLIIGLPEDVRAGLDAIRLLDQPRLAGQRSLRIEPIYWAVDKLSLKLLDILKIEGYNAAIGPTPVAGVTLLPMESINAILVFASEQALLDHVANWIRDLDQPSQADPLKRLFFYQVKNTGAEALGGVIGQVIEGLIPGSGGGSTPAPAPSAPVQTGVGTVGAPPPASSSSQRAVTAGRRIVVDIVRNSIIFQGTAEEYSQVRQLLETLDQPTRAVLIEVTVAEVTLDDETHLGVEYLLNLAGIEGGKIALGTLGGLGIGETGLNIRILNSGGATRALINALATSNRAQILSAPRLYARSGGEARIQVGREVPLLTSQTTSSQQIGGSTGVLQTIQYRSTGVLLTVKPIVHGSRRVDLDLTQEVSEPQTNRTSDLSTPVISNRKVQTQLSLSDGATIIMGGLIQTQSSDGNTGVPFLRDIPGVGQLFRVDSRTNSRTELIILITPYVVTSDEEAYSVTDAFRRKLGPWASPD